MGVIVVVVVVVKLVVRWRLLSTCLSCAGGFAHARIVDKRRPTAPPIVLPGSVRGYEIACGEQALFVWYS